MKTKSFIYVVLAGILWGTSGIFVKVMAPIGFTPLQMTFWRAIVSMLAMLVYVIFADIKLLKASGKDILLFVLSGISFFATASCYYACIQATSIATAVVLMYTAPIIVMIFSVLFLGEKLTALKTVAVVLMIIGCGLVSGIIGGLKFDLLGIGIGLLSGITYSAYNIFTKIQMTRRAKPISATLYCFVSATVLAAFVAEPANMIEKISPNPLLTVAMIIAMGICTCVLPYFLYTIALKNLPAGTATSLGIIEPMSATLFSVIIFKETLTILSLVGIVLILTSVFMLSREKSQDAEEITQSSE